MTLSTLACLALLGADLANEWPSWRGPLGGGEAPASAKPPIEWSKDKNLAWKAPLPGNGSSTPIVLGNQVFVLSAISAAGKPAAAPMGKGDFKRGEFKKGGGKGGFGRGEAPKDKHQFVALSIDRTTGKELWRTTLKEEVPHEGHHRDHGFASFSPVTDGERLYVFFGSRGLHALDLKGNKLWSSKDLGKQKTRAGFGEGSSPAVHNGVVVIVWDHEGDDFIAGFDAKTGEEKWRTPRNEDTSWTTPVISEYGCKAVAIVAGTNACRAYDVATGKEVWNAPGLTANVIPTGIVRGDTAYLTSGFRGAALYALKLGQTGKLAGDAILWRHDKGTPYVPSPALSGHRLYFFAGSNGVLTCLDVKTGKPLYESQRVPGFNGVYASPIAAGGHVYLVDRGGNTVVIKDADEFKVVAANDLGEGIDASPAAVGNELYLRGRNHLYKLAAGPGKTVVDAAVGK